MKRILSFLLVIVVISAMAVPAFASDYSDTLIYNGVELPNFLPVVEQLGVESDSTYFNFVVIYLNKTTGVYRLLVGYDAVDYVGAWNTSAENDDTLRHCKVFGYIENVHRYDCIDGIWVHEGEYLYCCPTVDNTDIVYVGRKQNADGDFDVYGEFGAYNLYTDETRTQVAFHGVEAVDPNAICDGSACIAVDVNFDDVCDECGLALAYNLRVAPDVVDIVINHDNGTTLLYEFTETLDGTVFNAVYDDERITVSFDNPVNHKQYKLVDGAWELVSTFNNIYTSHVISLSGSSSVYTSDLIIYDVNGEVFFQSPLWMEMGQVTQGEMGKLTAETVGTMKVLVLCGVGLIALLAVLKLFGRRSLISLKR